MCVCFSFLIVYFYLFDPVTNEFGLGLGPKLLTKCPPSNITIPKMLEVQVCIATLAAL